MKIVFYANTIPFEADSLTSRPLAGTESAIIYMAQELAKQGQNVIVFNKCQKSCIHKKVEYKNISNFKSYAEKESIDVLVSVRAIIFQEKFKIKSHIFWTGDNANEKFPKIINENSFSYELIDKVFVVSEYQKNNIQSTFNLPKEKLFVTRNGIDPDLFMTKKPRKKYKMVYISTPYRGLENLINIFPKIKSFIPEAELEVYSSMTLYGLSEEENTMAYGKIFLTLSNIDGVTLKPPLKKSDLAEVLKESYLMLYPNNFAETSCMAALEAQSAGVPVITSKLGALPETVEDNVSGFCIEGSVDDKKYKSMFIKKVVELIQDEQAWLKMSKQANQRIIKKYKWSDIAKEWVSEFSSLVKQYSNSEAFYKDKNIQLKSSKLTQLNLIYQSYINYHKNSIKNSKILFLEKDFLTKLLKHPDLKLDYRMDSLLRLGEISVYLANTIEAYNYFKESIDRFRVAEDKTKYPKVEYAYYYLINAEYLDFKIYNHVLLWECAENFSMGLFTNVLHTKLLYSEKRYQESVSFINKAVQYVENNTLSTLEKIALPDIYYFSYMINQNTGNYKDSVNSKIKLKSLVDGVE